MKKGGNGTIRINRIDICNYKGIDQLVIDSLPPEMSDAPDIFVMGSRNGLGKTSILECCSLLLFAYTLKEGQFRLRGRYSAIDIPDLLIKAGSDHAGIKGDIATDGGVTTVEIKIERNGVVTISRGAHSRKKKIDERDDPEIEAASFIEAICGFTPNPVVGEKLLFFHSYRKVQEGNPELGMMVERENYRPRHLPLRRYRNELPMSAFKLRMLRTLMIQADLFEISRQETGETDETITLLNKLVETYAGGRISKLRPSADNTVDFRIEPTRGGKSFTFDGLSSGQKEIISTLFLIWHYTRDKPSVVLIDEPELHLNVQWHRRFVKGLTEIAPRNQYILATHSEDVMDSVPERSRILLSDQGEDE